ncbi:hypothetical protein GMSM_28040 [Geomonas sp. Red276]
MTIRTKWEDFKESMMHIGTGKQRTEEERKEEQRKARERGEVPHHSDTSSGSETLDD